MVEVFGVNDDVIEQLLFELFGIVCPCNELVDGKLCRGGVSLWDVRENGSHPLHVVRHKPSAPIQVVEPLAEVEVVEEEHRRTDGAFEEVVHGVGDLKFDIEW